MQCFENCGGEMPQMPLPWLHACSNPSYTESLDGHHKSRPGRRLQLPGSLRVAWLASNWHPWECWTLDAFGQEPS